MAHVLLLGMTLSGKTHKAKALSHDYKRAGCGVLVLDPLQDPGWAADFITDNPDEFLKVYWQSRSCMAFMDEGGESVGRYDLAMSKTATRGRHWGHTNHYIAQRATQLAPLVRDQCTRLFLFCSSTKDGEVLAREWNRPELEQCSTLKQGEYYYAVKMGEISDSRIRERTSNRSNLDASIANRGRTRNDARGSDPQSRTGQKGVRKQSASRKDPVRTGQTPGSGVVQVTDSEGES